MPKLIKFLFKLALIVIVICLLWYFWQISRPVKLDGAVQFTIEEGEGVNQISYNLKEQGLIKNSFAFEIHAWLKGIESKFIADNYSLTNSLNIKNITKILTTPKPGDEWSLTVIEGTTIKEVAYKLENEGRFQAEELMEATGIGQPNNKPTFKTSNYDFLDDLPKNTNLEGYLYPDTYRFFDIATIDDIVTKMLDNFDSKLTDDLRAEIKRQNKTIFEIITMASILEKEAKIDPNNPSSDANIISGIFWKRIENGMPLQADSTMKYVLGHEPSSSDLKIDSPYNTYLYYDLPPGPICNPSLAAIKAAIYPTESEHWFFLTANDKVYYAETFDDHKNNIANYLR